jgi:hypothetical protein
MNHILDVAGQIADLKDTDYKNTLGLAVLIELMIDKGLLTREEFAAKAHAIEQATLAEMIIARRKAISGK